MVTREPSKSSANVGTQSRSHLWPSGVQRNETSGPKVAEPEAKFRARRSQGEKLIRKRSAEPKTLLCVIHRCCSYFITRGLATRGKCSVGFL